MKTLEPLPPHIEGPTWRRYNDGSWFLPDRSLGWELLGWIAEYLRSPTGDGRFMCTLEQARFLLWWYAVDERGEFIYRSGTLRRMKGAGKDVIAAAMSLAELCGPVAFSHFDESGDPVGKPRFNAWVQLAACSFEQTKNTRMLFPALITDHMKNTFKLEVGKTIIYSGAGGRIESLTSSPFAAEGNRPTFVVLNEAMELSTPIPTPHGWTTMGSLRTGDVIFGSSGQPTTVTKAHPVQFNRDCYRVTFVDGTSVVTSDGHLWQTKIAGSAAKPRIRTTREMAENSPNEDGAFSKKGRSKPAKFMIPRAGARQTMPVDLPVDPYLLGAWLGDGSTGECNITAHTDDAPAIQAELAKRGVKTRLLKSLRDTVQRISFTQGKNRPEVAIAMRKLSCYEDKHIPLEYLTAGTEQRLELLRGLMDTDGCAFNFHHRDGRPYGATRCIFIGRKQLAHDVLDLVRGLGQIAYISFVEDKRSREGGYYRVEFQAWRIQPFAMPRKANIVETSKRDWTTIKSIEPVESVPVRCIAVDADDHLFQAGESGFVTHNTQYFFEANSGHALAQVIEGNVTKVQGSRKLSICNAHVPGMDSVGERDWDAFQRVKSGDAIDTGVLYDSLEAPAGTPVSEIPAKDVDPDGHEQGLKRLREGIEIARGDAVWLPVNSIMDSILDTRNSVSESRRKYLNQVNAAEDSWISPQEWDRCAVTSEALALKANDRITLGFDGSKSSDWSALVACRVEDGFLTPIKVWNPKRYPNEEIPRDDVDATVRACFEQFDVVAFRADVKEFENYVDTWGRDFRRQLKINASRGHPVAFDMRGQKKPFSLDCESFLEAVLEEEICHSGDPILRQHVLNSKRHATNWGAVSIRKVSRDSSRKIDAAVCAVLAFGARREYLNSKKVRTGHVAIIQ